MKQSSGSDKKGTTPSRKLFPHQTPFNCIQFITGALPPLPAPPLSICLAGYLCPLPKHPFDYVYLPDGVNEPTEPEDKIFTIRSFLSHPSPNPSCSKFGFGIKKGALHWHQSVLCPCEEQSEHPLIE